MQFAGCRKCPAVEQCPRPTFMGFTCEPGWRGRRATSNISTRELYHLLAAPPRCVGPAHYSDCPEATAIRKTSVSVSWCPRPCSCARACAPKHHPSHDCALIFHFHLSRRGFFFYADVSPRLQLHTLYTAVHARTHPFTLPYRPIICQMR